jgi:hypothetical protein
LDSIKRAIREIEAPERTAAVIEVIETTLGIKIGPTEITEAAMSLSNEEKIQLAATLWAAAMPPMEEPTAGVYVLSAKEQEVITQSLLDSMGKMNAHSPGLETTRALLERLVIGDHA